MQIFKKACGWLNMSLFWSILCERSLWEVYCVILSRRFQCQFSTTTAAGLVCHYLQVMRCQSSESAIRITASDQVWSCPFFTVSSLCCRFSNLTTSGFLSLREVVNCCAHCIIRAVKNNVRSFNIICEQASLTTWRKFLWIRVTVCSFQSLMFPDIILHISLFFFLKSWWMWLPDSY